MKRKHVSHAEGELHKRFCYHLRAVRDRRRMTQTQLAHELGITRAYLADIERGRNCPTLSLVERCADTLCIDGSKFFRKTP